MKNYLHLFLVFISLKTFSQTEINASSGKAIGANGKIDFSVTNFSITQASNPNGVVMLTGVHQPIEISILPITLLSFDAVISEQKKIHIKWTTIYEYNNKEFILERSENGKDFNPLKTISSLGNASNLNQQYEYLDQNPFEKENFYRLKQVDLNGKITYSKTLKISFTADNSIKIFPNPTSNYLYINTPSLQGNLKYTISNINGKVLMEQKILSNSSIIDLTGINRGTYFITILSNYKLQQSFKIIKN
ncbi:MAG: T9SS type A sorting domain-containing protein [Chitinophagaceae bacterium]|jgi:hypothetical protein